MPLSSDIIEANIFTVFNPTVLTRRNLQLSQENRERTRIEEIIDQRNQSLINSVPSSSTFSAAAGKTIARKSDGPTTYN